MHFSYFQIYIAKKKNVSAYHLKIAKPAPPVCPEQNRLWKVVEKVPRTFFFQNLNIHFQAKVSFSVFFWQKIRYFEIQGLLPPGYWWKQRYLQRNDQVFYQKLHFVPAQGPSQRLKSKSFAGECWNVFEVQPCPGVAVFWQSGSFDLDSKVNRCQSVKFKSSTNKQCCTWNTTFRK